MIENFLILIQEYGIIFAFLAGLITGESFIIPLAFLSAQGYIPLWVVVVFCTLGMYLAEFVPFTLGKIKHLRSYLERKVFSEKTVQTEKKLHLHAKKRPFLTLLVAKFAYGLSIPTLVYFGYKKILSYKQFAIYMFFINLIFVPILILIGWGSGKGFTLLNSFFKEIRISIFLLILAVIIFFYVRKWVRRKLTKMQELSV